MKTHLTGFMILPFDTSQWMTITHPSGAPNNQAGINSESANSAALKFGIRFTT
jgi:hypothetical protein